MPLFGRYLLKNYLKVFFLAIFSFIALLVVSRLEEIAQFAALGAPMGTLALFTAYQIPYILPIAIPISCVLSAMILFQRISHTQELTALRASGIPLRHIMAPVLIAGAFLAFITFTITSELATSSHLASRQMVYKLTSSNPLLLLQSTKLARLKDAYIQLDPVRNGEAAQNCVMGFYQNRTKRLSIALADEVALQSGEVRGEKVTFISSTPSEGFDHLVIESGERAVGEAPEYARLLKKQGWKIANDHLSLSLLRVRREHIRKQLEEKPAGVDLNKLKRNYVKSETEIVRRCAVGFAAFTFTFLGVAFGLEISRNPTKKGVLTVFGLTALAFISFFVAKELDHLFWVATTLFLAPHVLILGASLLSLYRVNRGIE